MYQTEETRTVEKTLGQHFNTVKVERYNNASIRVVVIDPQFENITREKRDTLVEQFLKTLPAKTQQDILTLFTLTPTESKIFFENSPTTTHTETTTPHHPPDETTMHTFIVKAKIHNFTPELVKEIFENAVAYCMEEKIADTHPSVKKLTDEQYNTWTFEMTPTENKIS